MSRPSAEVFRISELVSRARAGQLRVPPFQRDFRWDSGDVLKLFESVWLGYPIGSLLLWRRTAPEAVLTFGSFSVTAEATPEALWVVDGQHRLTAFVAALAPVEASGPFELFFDLEAERLRRRIGAGQPPPTWLPIAGLLDQNSLLSRLLLLKGDSALTDEQIELALDVANRVRDYEVPVSIVHTSDEQEVRRIFDLLNSSGKRLKASEVFHALHAATTTGTTRLDLDDLVDDVSSQGFGLLQKDTVLRCLLATRGGDPYRDFRDEFQDAEVLENGLATGRRALLAALAFLERDAWIPHRRALPYTATLPVLARFFALFPEPADQTRQLLRRWVWRGALAWRGGRDVAVVRRAVQQLEGDEATAVLHLLGELRATQVEPLDLGATQLNRAAGRLNVALLNALEPLDLRDGTPVDVSAVLDGESPLGQLTSAAGLAGRLLHPPVDDDELQRLVAAAAPRWLATHAISDAARDALVAGDDARFAELREPVLAGRLNQRRADLAEFDAVDRPAIDALLVPD